MGIRDQRRVPGARVRRYRPGGATIAGDDIRAMLEGMGHTTNRVTPGLARKAV